MANHAKVLTKKKMTPEKITEILNGLNLFLFKDLLKIEYTDCTDKPGSWGKHVWYITVKGGEHEYQGQTYHRYGERECWLNSSRSFEMRHGGGGEFIWWVDGAILNEIALKFDGRHYDDGVGNMPVAEGLYASFKDYLLRANRNKIDFIKSRFVQEMIPPEFKWNKVK